MKESFGEQQHQAVTTLRCVRTRHVEEMHGKDIRNSDRNSELNSQKQKQSQHQKSVDQTLNAKMMDENNEIFKHDTEFHEFCRNLKPINRNSVLDPALAHSMMEYCPKLFMQ